MILYIDGSILREKRRAAADGTDILLLPVNGNARADDNSTRILSVLSQDLAIADVLRRLSEDLVVNVGNDSVRVHARGILRRLFLGPACFLSDTPG